LLIGLDEYQIQETKEVSGILALASYLGGLLTYILEGGSIIFGFVNYKLFLCDAVNQQDVKSIHE
jgi:hypothetical protein